MKRKLRIEELSVTSFSTQADDGARERGTVRGYGIDPNPVPTEGTCELRTCDLSCQGAVRSCVDTCANTCPFTCATCITCNPNHCP